MPLIGSNLPHTVVEEGIIHRVFPLTPNLSSKILHITKKIRRKIFRLIFFGATQGVRTLDLRITNALLYQLS